MRTLMTDGNGRLMRDECETIPMFCPMCRCQDCGLMADNADIDVELDCDEIVFEWSDADDSQTCNLPPCYGGHRLQTDMTAYDLLLELGVIDDPYARNKERD